MKIIAIIIVLITVLIILFLVTMFFTGSGKISTIPPFDVVYTWVSAFLNLEKSKLEDSVT